MMLFVRNLLTDLPMLAQRQYTYHRAGLNLSRFKAIETLSMAIPKAESIMTCQKEPCETFVASPLPAANQASL